MDWKEKAGTLHNTSTLSPRKAQIAVLHSQGLSPKEIQHQIYSKTGDKLTIKSINSTISRLRKEQLNAYTTVNVLGGGFSQTHLPVTTSHEIETGEVETCIYTGQIGSGKIESALNHTYILSEEHQTVDETILFDANSDGLLTNLHSQLTESHRIPVSDQTKLPTQELMSKVNQTTSNSHTLILVNSAYHVLRNNKNLIRKITENGSNISLRFVGKDLLSIIENPIDSVSMAHIFRTRNVDASTFVSTVENQSDLYLTPDLSGFIRYLPANKKQPSAAITAVTKTGETWIAQQLPSSKTPIEV